MNILPQSFYNRNPLEVAQELLGKILVRNLNGVCISGRIVETEAYLAFVDEAAHSYAGQTKRTASLFKSAGHAYVHSIHMQQCLDIVTEMENIPSSVLLRALQPIEGIEHMKAFRKKEKLTDLTSGPGKLTQALQISKQFDGVDITSQTSQVYIISDDYTVPTIVSKKRIGISKAKDHLFRFYIQNSPYISKK